jgi:hypothetical protein
MNSVMKAAILFIGASMSTACGPSEYRPLREGEEVHMHVNGYTARFISDGAEHRADAEAFLLSGGEEKEIGLRSNADGEYLPDTFVVENGREEVPLSCFRWEDRVPNDFDAFRCEANFKQAEPGQWIRVRFNDFNNSVVIMPEVPALMSPEENSEFSVGSGEDLVLSWASPGRAGADPMRWSLAPYRDGEPTSCVGNTTWNYSSGEMDDTGSFIIPKDELPADLPVEGCPVSLQISRGREGTLDPGIELGQIYGRQYDRVFITLKP